MMRDLLSDRTRAFVVIGHDAGSIVRENTAVYIEAPGLTAEEAQRLVIKRLRRQEPRWYTPIVLQHMTWDVVPVRYKTQSTLAPKEGATHEPTPA